MSIAPKRAGAQERRKERGLKVPPLNGKSVKHSLSKPKDEKHDAPNGAHRRDAEHDNMLELHSVISTYHEELLAQNEQLMQAHAELERSRDRYARLYDEAPVG